MLFLYGEQNKGLPEQWFTSTVLLRDVAVMALCALVIRQIYRPDLDLVRHHGQIDDPSGGPFDGAPDGRRRGGRDDPGGDPAARFLGMSCQSNRRTLCSARDHPAPPGHRRLHAGSGRGAWRVREGARAGCPRPVRRRRPAPPPSRVAPRADGEPSRRLAAVRYLSLGDSLTQGIGAADLDNGTFPALLAEKWRAAGCEVELQNVGISGYTAGQVLSDEVPNIADFQPTVITFQAGGNDIANAISLDEYRKQRQGGPRRGDRQRRQGHRAGAERVVPVAGRAELRREPGGAARGLRCRAHRGGQRARRPVRRHAPAVQAAGRRRAVGRGRLCTRRRRPTRRGRTGIAEAVPAPCK